MKSIYRVFILTFFIFTACIGGNSLGQYDFRLPSGIEIDDISGISEGYSEYFSEKGFHSFKINVSSEKIADCFKMLVDSVEEPGFFIIEVGVSESDENKLRKRQSDPFHKYVYYLDGISVKTAKKIFHKYENLLVNDGMVNFGYGSHNGYDEVYVGPYKIFEIYADHPEKYHRILNSMNFSQTAEIKTVWDNFSDKNPGIRNSLKVDFDIWDMIAELEKNGLYKAGIREE